MKTYLIPVSGDPLPYPGGVLPAEGDHVEMDRFWRRRLRDGSVVTGRPRRDSVPRQAEPSSPAEAVKAASPRRKSGETND
ncbi:DUF2635 domain-containing protein [Pararhodobacter sp.]|uniref:DUF2635 domain-containing protein n=1 Tax=Pararhodobacter sp. TaxID=2127056 RepID=UPI002AFF0305|nr:DUF2635 domain-containing protein [Pararhodobacter sp.]